MDRKRGEQGPPAESGTAPPAVALTTNIGALPGVGPRRAEAFRRLGVRSVADLIRHLPMRYEDEQAEKAIDEVLAAATTAPARQSTVTVRGEITQARAVRARRSRFEALIDDGTGTVLLTWFNAPWLRGRLHPGQWLRATGRLGQFGSYPQMVNPRWEPIGDGRRAPFLTARRRPIYPGSEDLPSPVIERGVGAVLDHVLPGLEDHLDPAYRARRALPTLAEAYRMIHRPRDSEEAARARRRLAFDELLMLQLGVWLKRHHRRRTLLAPALGHDAAIDRHITARFPFALTPSQRRVIDEIVADLATSTPMNRLLQGDVGAGKTVVALYAMLLAVASGQQAALMAPTELLAEQHFASISAMLAGSSVRLELLTGSLGARDHAALLGRLERGEVDLVVGTHALLTETVSFRSLAVSVIDEQHRFGVHQRATLRSKSRGDHGDRTIPHTLVMTATPIPRTLSLTVFGDLDVSVIGELPPGRGPLRTEHVARARAGKAYEEVARRIAAGEQAYVVVPVIDESAAALTDIHSHLAWLEGGPLAGRRLAAVHGRLTRQERDRIMGRFRDGRLDALVATTVIEVGVDVPNATVMVIEHAERFGLAQLHQLRGRVGRGPLPSCCLLIADPGTEEARQRIEAIVATADGFQIAERDLTIRGPGELFGARQSGLPPFHAAELPRDLELLRLARRDAAEWIAANPTLGGPRDALLRRRLLKTHGEALGLGDVG